jgi:hypothetical protein
LFLFAVALRYLMFRSLAADALSAAPSGDRNQKPGQDEGRDSRPCAPGHVNDARNET